LITICHGWQKYLARFLPHDKRDAAFDQGLIAFDDNLLMLLSKRITDFLPHESIQTSFEAYSGKPLQLPADAMPPDAGFLSKHRARFKFN